MKHAFVSEPEFVGIPIYFSGHTWLVPSLSVRQFQEHYKVLTNPPTGESEEEMIARFNVMIPIIGQALRRNYPAVTDEELFDVLDMTTFGDSLRAVQNSTGMKAVKPGESVTQTAP